jgi:hypothetical protein
LRPHKLLYTFAALVPLTAALQAGTVDSNTVNFDLTSGMFNNTVLSSSFTPFDTTLGTLTQAQAFANGTLTATLDVNGVGSGSFTVEDAFGYGADFELAGIVGETGFFDANPLLLTCTSPPSQVSACDYTSPDNATLNPSLAFIPLVSVSTFTGPGNILFTLSPNSYVGTIGSTGNVSTDAASFASGPDISGSIYLQYTYTPFTSTPEPSSKLLLGAGLAMIAWAGRRRNHLFRMFAGQGVGYERRRKPAAWGTQVGRRMFVRLRYPLYPEGPETGRSSCSFFALPFRGHNEDANRRLFGGHRMLHCR